MLEYKRKKTSNRVDALISLISFPELERERSYRQMSIVEVIALITLIVAIINLCFYIFFEASKKEK